MNRVLLALGFVILLGLGTVLLASGAADGWERVGEGIEYRMYTLPDPNRVFVSRMDRSNPNVTIETSIGYGRLVDGLETVSAQAARYDQALNWWGDASDPHNDGAWGGTNQVVVAINGTFTLPPDYQQAWQGQVHSGWHMWPFEDSATRNAFLWKLDRTPWIGGCVLNPDAKQLVHYESGTTQEISGVNIPRGEDELIIYTPQYDRDTNTDDSGTEVLVEMTRPALISNSEQIIGYVRQIRNWLGSSPIPFDYIVLSAQGTAASKLKNNVDIGDQVGITQFVRNCDSESTLDWNGTFAAMVSNNFYFLKDGAYQPNSNTGANVRNPRTAVAFNDQYVYFIVVDGRFEGVSIGMDMERLASFARDQLGALHGLSLDGGGSSTMVVNGKVVNFPSDGIPDLNLDPLEQLGPRYVFALQGVPEPNLPSSSLPHIYLPIIQNAEPESQPTPTPIPLPIVERGVPNGLMMVVVQPVERTTAFKPGDQVAINAAGNVNLRLGPGTNYMVMDILPNGAQGEVLDHLNGLNGVRAKGYNWWKVRFDGVEGWIAESLLKKIGP